MTGVRVRRARESDLADLFELERSIATAPHWPRTAYSEIVADQIFAPRRCLLVADGLVGEPPGLRGFAIGVVHPAGDAELESVAVAETARRLGIGAALCEAVAQWCRGEGATELLLEVRGSSAGAIALYRGLGFVVVGRRAGYYRDPTDDAVQMRLELKACAEPR